MQEIRVTFSRDVLPLLPPLLLPPLLLLLLLPSCAWMHSCVVADSGEGKSCWTDDVARRAEM